MKVKGLFFTVGALILIIPLIFFVAYYSTMAPTKTADTVSKIRCDELHYFVEDVRGDLERALVIFGRRATIYAIDDVVKSGKPLNDYVFNCSTSCNLDCSEFKFEVNGSESALAELMLCGTLHGQNVTYMTNHTVSQWINRIQQHAKDMHFNVTITMRQLKITPKDPWTYQIYTNSTFNVFDESGTCYYVGDNIITSSPSSILGLEDPLYPLNTNSEVIKFINNCTTKINLQMLAGCSKSDLGNGTGTGRVIFYSHRQPHPGWDDFCSTTPNADKYILVIDQAIGGGSLCTHIENSCFNASSPSHLAGLINEGPDNINSLLHNCEVTIPWITDTGVIDDDPEGHPGWDPDPNCFQANISNDSCVEIHNDENCGLYQVLVGQDAESLNTTCYQLSNVSEYVFGGVNGPSFFDRLDGNLNLTNKYANQSFEYFGTRLIGIETLVSPYDLNRHGVRVNTNATWVDYLYWAGVDGCGARGFCEGGRYAFRLEEEHVPVYKVETECAIIPGCPNSAETCVDFIDQDNDTQEDWRDYDCNPSFARCGEIQLCGITGPEECESCDDTTPEQMSENTTRTCNYYGYNDTEWHFYRITPTSDGRLSVFLNSTSNVTDAQKTDFSVYNYSVPGVGCTSQVERFQDIEGADTDTVCVLAYSEYILGLDVDVPSYGYNGSYVMNVTVTPDPTCASGTTSTTTTSTTGSTTTTTICGFYDDMESDKEWNNENEWIRGVPSKPGWSSCFAGSCFVTDLYGPYDNNANESLTSPWINLAPAAGGAATLRYHLTYKTEDKRDYVHVESSDDGVSWMEIVNYTKNNGNGDVYSHNMNSYAGGLLKVRFRLTSDSSGDDRGAMVDNVNVTCY
ncbi:MAG: hypothetical protein V1744_01465 [Candidatus Altiarchaeota archaeon]